MLFFLFLSYLYSLLYNILYKQLIYNIVHLCKHSANNKKPAVCNLLTDVCEFVCNVYRIKHNVYKIVCNVYTERISLFADGVQHNTQLKNNNTKKRVIKICQSLRDRLFFLRSFFYREASLSVKLHPWRMFPYKVIKTNCL